MASIKDYNRKIGSLKNTTKITRTMKMVSASKLRRAQEAQRKAHDYAIEINNLIGRLAGSIEDGSHPLVTSKKEVKNVLLLVYSSDKGLCAGFNNNLIRFVERYVKKNSDKDFAMSFCGRRGYNHFRSRARVISYYEDVTAKPESRNASLIADELKAAFTSGEFDEVHLVYNRFISPLSQVPEMRLLLPLSAAEFTSEEEQVGEDNFIAEPAMDQLLAHLIPRLVVFKLFYALLENSAGEHGARMTAMDNATSNATSLIDQYTLLRNRARQAAITTELIEIISGAEAL